MVGFLPEVYDILPNYFAYSDPDLLLNEKLPSQFLNILKDLTNKYLVYKAGFALALDEIGELKDTKTRKYSRGPIVCDKIYSISEWEEQFWRIKINHPNLELYYGHIDTTFAVYNKTTYFFNFYSAIRVAGSFSAIHLPWFKELEIMTKEEESNYKIDNKFTTWK